MRSKFQYTPNIRKLNCLFKTLSFWHLFIITTIKHQYSLPSTERPKRIFFFKSSLRFRPATLPVLSPDVLLTVYVDICLFLNKLWLTECMWDYCFSSIERHCVTPFLLISFIFFTIFLVNYSLQIIVDIVVNHVPFSVLPVWHRNV